MRVRIDRIGGRGDGIADTDAGPVYVPFTVPGDVVEVDTAEKRGDGLRGRLRRIVEPGEARVDGACPHFGTCGGCALQHLAPAAYLDWKRRHVVDSLARHGIDVPVAETFSVPPGTRRRVRLAFRRTARGVMLGFREAASDRIVDLAACPVTRPEIVRLMPALRDLLSRHARAGEVAVTLAETGFDVAVYADTEIGLDLRMDAAPFCDETGSARLSWATGKAEPEQIVAMGPVQVSFGGIPVALPVDAFLQPTAEGEAALTAFVLEALADTKDVCDLFAGCGAFALPLSAAGHGVHAVEGLAAQVRAAARAAPTVTAEIRDLSRQPLRIDELSRFGGAVLDPPRAGAAAQVAELAGSRVERVAYVSCNPATFARDARTLVDGGYVLEQVLPVDQFLWSPHVELASVFRRPG